MGPGGEWAMERLKNALWGKSTLQVFKYKHLAVFFFLKKKFSSFFLDLSPRIIQSKIDLFLILIHTGLAFSQKRQVGTIQPHFRIFFGFPSLYNINAPMLY